MTGSISGTSSQIEGVPNKNQDAALEKELNKTDQAAQNVIQGAIVTAANAATRDDIGMLTGNIKNISLSASQPNLSYSEIVDDFIEKLRGCGWSGNATSFKRSIIQNDRLDFYGYPSLTSLPPEIGNLRKLKVLDLDYTRITTLPPEIGNLLELQYLSLRNTLITTLPPEAGNLSNLQSLHLRGTSITTLPDAIKDLRQLTLLNLTGCPIVAQGDGTNLGRRELRAHFGDRVLLDDTKTMQQMPPHTIDAVKTAASAAVNTDITKLTENIKNISLSASQPNLSYSEIVDDFIEKLQKCGFDDDTRKLKKSIIQDGCLDLSGTRITTLPHEIGLLSNLRVLYLNDTRITTLPPEIGSLHNLQELYFWRTPITTLPPEIGNLRDLRILKFHITRIATLPPEIGNLRNLQILIFDHTPITTLPPEVGNLLKLQRLQLNRTPITTLPPEIGNLLNLQELWLNATRITTLPPEIGNLLSLQKLWLNATRITTLPPEIGNLFNLQALHLNGAPITTLPSTIRELRQLTELNLRDQCPIVAQGDETNLGRRELRAHFGDRVLLDDVTVQQMPLNTTKEEVYRALDSKAIHVNREQLKRAVLPEIPDVSIENGEEFLLQFSKVISQLNFDNETASDYLSHQLLASDFASEARDPHNSNWDKIQSNVIPRLTGYFKTLYDLPLEEGEMSGWQMNDDKKPALKKALSYILDQLGSLEDREQRAMLFTQLVHGMLHCPTGQKEGIDTVIIALLDAKTMRASDIELQVHNIIALKKAEFFKTAILTKGAENSQNVHLISTYERLLKEELGLSNILAYEERMGIMGTDPFNNNPNNVLKIFYDLVTPERMAQWLLEKVESSHELALQKELGELEKKQAQFTAPRTWEARLAAAPVEQHAAIQAQIDSLQRVSGVDVSDKISELKARIKINAQFKPITTQAILTYLIDKKIVDTTQDTWWQEYFSADPAVDETAALTHQGAMTLLTKLGYVIGSRCLAIL